MRQMRSLRPPSPTAARPCQTREDDKHEQLLRHKKAALPELSYAEARRAAGLQSPKSMKKSIGGKGKQKWNRPKTSVGQRHEIAEQQQQQQHEEEGDEQEKEEGDEGEERSPSYVMGQQIHLTLTETWGDPHYVGLTAVQVLLSTGPGTGAPYSHTNGTSSQRDKRLDGMVPFPLRPGICPTVSLCTVCTMTWLRIRSLCSVQQCPSTHYPSISLSFYLSLSLSFSVSPSHTPLHAPPFLSSRARERLSS